MTYTDVLIWIAVAGLGLFVLDQVLRQFRPGAPLRTRVVAYLDSRPAWKASLRRIPFFEALVKRVSKRDTTLDATSALFYMPYLEHCNIPPLGAGTTEPERAGYSLGRLMYQYRRREVLQSSGDRFHHIFQHKLASAKDPGAFRIFTMGASTAFGHGAAPEERYYSLLEKAIRRPFPVAVVPAAVSAINSTQQSILFNLTLLPLKPDCIILIDGWNDIGLPSLFSVRPGDPMNISTLYQKYHHNVFNLMLTLGAKSSWVDKRIMRRLQADRADFLKYFFADGGFQRDVLASIVNVYLSNLDNIVENCRLRKIDILHFIQPSADVLLERRKTGISEKEHEAYTERVAHLPWAHVGLSPFLNKAFTALEEGIKSRPWNTVSQSLLTEFTLDDYLDPAHLNKQGQAKLAKILLDKVDSLLPAAKPVNGWVRF